MHADGKVAAVLDIDSPLLNRFSEEDRDGLVKLVRSMEKVLIWE